MSDYGTAYLRHYADGTVTVDHADDCIGVTRDWWDSMASEHHRADGHLQLDTAGEYVYRHIRDDLSLDGFPCAILVFTRITTGRERNSA